MRVCKRRGCHRRGGAPTIEGHPPSPMAAGGRLPGPRMTGTSRISQSFEAVMTTAGATALLYQTDSYLRTFDATVVAVEPERHAVMLDRTAFYPGGGGQPCDHGWL